MAGSCHFLAAPFDTFQASLDGALGLTSRREKVDAITLAIQQIY